MSSSPTWDSIPSRIRLDRGGGLAGALNTGMRRCGSEFAAILLGDDLWAANAVAVLGDHIATSPDVDFFHSARAIIDDDGNRISSVYAPVQHVAPADFLYWSAVKHLLCWRVSKALAIGGMDESLRSVRDMRPLGAPSRGSCARR